MHVWKEHMAYGSSRKTYPSVLCMSYLYISISVFMVSCMHSCTVRRLCIYIAVASLTSTTEIGSIV